MRTEVEPASVCLLRVVSRPGRAVWNGGGPAWGADESLDERKLLPAVVWGRSSWDEPGHLRDLRCRSQMVRTGATTPRSSLHGLGGHFPAGPD